MSREPDPSEGDAAESARLAEDARREKNWKRWGPYLPERQWATVREDVSADGSFWESFPYEHSRGRAYRWGEDGLLGITDRECRLCFALALWNGEDAHLKERLFGLTNREGNHSEDVKEVYFYLDATPTHAYLKVLYKYPQTAFLYEKLRAENRRQGRGHPEYELTDAGAFDGDRYWDVTAEYAKAAPDDILIRVTVANRGPESARLHLLPTLWFRNTWSWEATGDEGRWRKPRIGRHDGGLLADHETLGRFRLAVEETPAEWLFTENETNPKVHGGSLLSSLARSVGMGGGPYKELFTSTSPIGVKRRLKFENGRRRQQFTFWTSCREVRKSSDSGFRTKARRRRNPSGGLTRPSRAGSPRRTPSTRGRSPQASPGGACGRPASLRGPALERAVYHYVVPDWLPGDPKNPFWAERQRGRVNRDWPHIFSRDVLSVPDKWEYTAFFAWDLAFHMIPMARIDPDFAKAQLLLLMRE